MSWFIDSRLLSTGNANDQQSIQWTVTSVADGSQLLLAVWARANSSPIEPRRTVRVTNPMLIRFRSGGNDLYRFTVDVPIDNPPVLNVSVPVTGAFVQVRLRVQGMVSSYKPGLVTVTARRNDIPFLPTTAKTYSGSYDLTGFAAGPYMPTARATDSTGKDRQAQRTAPCW